MKKLTQALLFAGVIAPTMMVAAPAMADDASPVTANVSLVSDYVTRGIDQTNKEMALQGGFDYAHSSGLYIGTWASNITWLKDAGDTGSSSLEVDVYAGFRGSVTDDFGYDVGILHYDYPSSYMQPSPNTDEIYLAGTYKMFTLKYSQSTTNLFGWADSKNSSYLDASASFDLGSGFTLGLHAGHQKIKGTFSGASYTDYKVSISKALGGGLSAGLAFTDTNADATNYYTNSFGTNISGPRVIASVSKSF